MLGKLAGAKQEELAGWLAAGLLAVVDVLETCWSAAKECW
jgi:hypothetical protein